MRREIEIE